MFRAYTTGERLREDAGRDGSTTNDQDGVIDGDNSDEEVKDFYNRTAN